MAIVAKGGTGIAEYILEDAQDALYTCRVYLFLSIS